MTVTGIAVRGIDVIKEIYVKNCLVDDGRGSCCQMESLVYGYRWLLECEQYR